MRGSCRRRCSRRRIWCWVWRIALPSTCPAGKQGWSCCSRPPPVWAAANLCYLKRRFLYDDKGSSLYERITGLPEYLPYRTEQQLLVQQHMPPPSRHTCPRAA
ncbi:hypothetical protein CHLNCDRAFT_20419 [Chlorella variabilis]|uniref:Histidine-specific methyltransferase SAM-dependent domain-containing protein n=1 Tax=Chlorella variabilis TaxID=554065 RepID=E1Z7X6_CHLVA|nr:hypothetical protein CHLNCDRAFT_20419 [Chlorella variabilis]EFN57997.1 hypothetical protein CHLNCDRAFT_20419 [Chlorella variabilis]|eukprot:XP_005850099.1 hypothetical protein CHLNCDRAFT_20419 [Chlorella variabilis]